MCTDFANLKCTWRWQSPQTKRSFLVVISQSFVPKSALSLKDLGSNFPTAEEHRLNPSNRAPLDDDFKVFGKGFMGSDSISQALWAVIGHLLPNLQESI